MQKRVPHPPRKNGGNRTGSAVLQVAGLVLDRIAHSVQRDRHAIELSPKEFSLLEFLMRHAGQPVSRAVLAEQVWKLDCESMSNAVDVYINYLRRKIDSGYDFALIRTIHGVGYQIGARVPSPVKNVV
jgi:DNA-binding response OmpR family regulator